jgi:hypothetical protein
MCTGTSFVTFIVADIFLLKPETSRILSREPVKTCQNFTFLQFPLSLRSGWTSVPGSTDIRTWISITIMCRLKAATREGQPGLQASVRLQQSFHRYGGALCINVLNGELLAEFAF